MVCRHLFRILTVHSPTRRCFAASQTQGVANSVYQKYPTRADAQRAFDAATEAGEVYTL